MKTRKKEKVMNSIGSGVSKDTVMAMARSREVEEEKKEETSISSNEEREEESNNGIAGEDVLAGHENNGEVKNRKKEKRDHMKLFDDKETTVEKKKQQHKGKENVVGAGIEGKRGERKKEMTKDDTKAHNKEKKRKRKLKDIEDVVFAENEANCKGLKSKKRKRDSSKLVTPESNKSREVGFSEEVKDLPPFEEDGLVQGKWFSNVEDELIKKAVDRYIEAMQLGKEGLDMVLECKSHPQVKDCWKVIGAALPWRPIRSVYLRTQNLYKRGESKWTTEEVEFVREFYKKNGPKWKMMADKLGKYHIHVRYAFQRYKLVDLNKGKWSQDEYRRLFELVNEDLLLKVSEDKKSKHGMLRDNIHWEAISDELGTRNNATCCKKWYRQLRSPMVAQGEWADVDDYRMVRVLVGLDASCEEEVDWENLLEHRSGDLCRKRWLQMSRHLGEHGNKSFSEQVDVLSERYCPDFAEVREALDARPVVN